GRKCFIYADALLHEPEDILKSNDLPYTIYTPFMRKSRTLPVLKPLPCRNTNFYQIIIDHSITLNPYLKKQARYATIQGGRTEGKKLLHKISALKNYSENRNYQEKNATSHLSAHHKFGTVSIRESYQAIVDAHGLQSTLINELYWRDFFTHIGFHFPHIFKGAFHQKYNAIAWKDNAAQFKKWCDGKTGFPIVDAGMRELNETGYMHNRVRMITASFLVKDVHIDWRWGERYFAQKLVDYDPAVNNGNWQWVASTGCDSQPYFRIFNPWLQQKRFDKACLYIKKWVSELKTASPRDLHNLSVTSSLTNYPKPMVNHAEAAAVAKNLFKL
ncbi:MAG: deoxyribodipyrimidine photo-lyase, partial [Gammaproteobacteria bacterium]|nr:deoxyribodipyrimidine photo-lyase [Gammaproteobacteria bacterium]